jgi:hypothetical protein
MVKRMMWAVLFLFGFSIFLFPWMYANHGECFFIPNECEAGQSFSSPENVPGTILGDMIVSGACAYLDSYSFFLNYLTDYEAGRSNQKEDLVKAYEKISAAVSIYKKLCREAAEFPYNDSAVDRLKQFDYPTYAGTNDLMPRVFAQVRVLLENGDVKGIFQEIARRVRVIADKLGPAAMNSVPGDIELWRLSQAYAETLLFGQYAAEIFERCR